MNLSAKSTDIKKKIYAYYMQDGLTELMGGMFFIFYSAVCDYAVFGHKSGHGIGRVGFYLCLLPVILGIMRLIITYPRLGFAKLKDEIKPAFFIFVILPLILVPFALTIAGRIMKIDISQYEWMRYSSVAFSLVFCGLFYSLVLRSGNKVYYAFIVFSVLFGIAMTLAPFTCNVRGFLFYTGIMGVICLIFGFVKLLLFIKKYPKANMEDPANAK